MKILALVPVKKNMHRELRLRCFDSILNLQSYFQGQIEIRVDNRGPGDSMVTDFTSLERVKNLADVRQGMVNDYLRQEHTHVLMVDADAEYTPKTVTDLLRTSKEDIVAPSVYIEPSEVWDMTMPRREWYDTWAFIQEDDSHVQMFSPYFKTTEPVVPMICVGTMYVVPADLFRQGAKYVAIDKITEHFSVCAFARNHGRRVLCNRNVVIQHPRLTNYGERRGA